MIRKEVGEEKGGRRERKTVNDDGCANPMYRAALELMEIGVKER